MNTLILILMKKKLVFIAFAAAGILITSCEKEKVSTDKITFESFSLDESGFYNGSDLSGDFTIGNVVFSNSFDPEYQSWLGFSISNHTDTNTRGWQNQYSSISGGGASGSKNYAVFHTWTSDTLTFLVPEKVTNISFCNSTYAYYSMLEGDDFAKQFGGGSGDELDYFSLYIDCYDESGRIIGNGELNLADYRFDNNAEDYIANAWSDLDLSAIGYIKYMVLSFDSSDKGIYGINTPQYVCVDNIFGELQE